MYEIHTEPEPRPANPQQIIRRLSDEAIIPMNPDNRDYQEYLEWVAEGNTAAVID